MDFPRCGGPPTSKSSAIWWTEACLSAVSGTATISTRGIACTSKFWLRTARAAGCWPYCSPKLLGLHGNPHTWRIHPIKASAGCPKPQAARATRVNGFCSSNYRGSCRVMARRRASMPWSWCSTRTKTIVLRSWASFATLSLPAIQLRKPSSASRSRDRGMVSWATAPPCSRLTRKPETQVLHTYVQDSACDTWGVAGRCSPSGRIRGDPKSAGPFPAS